MAGGRPTKYKPEICKTLKDYFSVDLYTVKNGKKEANLFPTFEGFSFEYEINHQTMLDWCKVRPEFLEAYKWCKSKQKQLIMQGGMSGAYNAQFTIFVAKNVTDMKDRVEHVDVSKEETEELVKEAKQLIKDLE